jgi:hypothetical protein
MTHYKSLISIFSTCNYATSSHAMSFFSVEKYFENSSSKSRHLSPLTKNSKILRKLPHATSYFSIKNNSKKSRKSPHARSYKLGGGAKFLSLAETPK